MRSRPDNHLLILNYFRSTGSSMLQPQLNPSSLWAVTLVCHFGYIFPTYPGSATLHLYLMKKASQTFRLLLHDLQFNSVPKLFRSLGSADLTYITGPDTSNIRFTTHVSLLYFHYSLRGWKGHSIITSLSPFRCKKTDLFSFSLSCSHQGT